MQTGTVRQKYNRLKEELETANAKEEQLRTRLDAAKERRRTADEDIAGFDAKSSALEERLDEAERNALSLEKKAKTKNDEADEMHRQLRSRTQAAIHARTAAKGRRPTDVDRKLIKVQKGVEASGKLIEALQIKAKRIEVKVEEAENRIVAGEKAVRINEQKLTGLTEDVGEKQRSDSHSKSYTEKLTSRLTKLETKLAAVNERVSTVEPMEQDLDKKLEESYDERDKWKKDFHSVSSELASVKAELEDL